jgi:ankyrin repeat protein
MHGHLNIIELLASEYGADILLPVKLIDPDTKNAKGAIMTIVLTMFLPAEKSKKVLELLLQLGATSGQGDMNHITSFHYLVAKGEQELLDVLLTHDEPVTKGVLNNLGFKSQWGSETVSPLLSAIESGHSEMVSKLLAIGAKPTVTFEDWIKAYLERNSYAKNNSSERNMALYHEDAPQPVMLAANKSMGKVVNELIAKGADPNTMTRQGYQLIRDLSHSRYNNGETLLDLIQKKLKELRHYQPEDKAEIVPPETLKDEDFYTCGLTEGSYKYWTALQDFRAKKLTNDNHWKRYKEAVDNKKSVRTVYITVSKIMY